MGCKKFKLRQHEIFSKKSNHLVTHQFFKKNGIGLFFENLKRILFRYQIRENFGIRKFSNFQPLAQRKLNLQIAFYGSTIMLNEKFEFGLSCRSFIVSLSQKFSMEMLVLS